MSKGLCFRCSCWLQLESLTDCSLQFSSKARWWGQRGGTAWVLMTPEWGLRCVTSAQFILGPRVPWWEQWPHLDLVYSPTPPALHSYFSSCSCFIQHIHQVLLKPLALTNEANSPMLTGPILTSIMCGLPNMPDRTCSEGCCKRAREWQMRGSSERLDKH